MYYKRLDTLKKELEDKTNKLSQDIYKFQDNSTKLRINSITKDVKEIRNTLSQIISYTNSFRIW